jgi:thiol:disulfide interchange protein
MRLASAAGISLLRRVLSSLTALTASACFGQQLDPVQWSMSSDVQRVRPGDSVALQLAATIEQGWHLYSLTTPGSGPIPTTATLRGGTLQNTVLYQPAPDRRFDRNFNLDVETFSDEATLLISGSVPSDMHTGRIDVTADVRYQACSDRQCLPPKTKPVSFGISVDTAAPAQPKVQIPKGYTPVASVESPALRIPATMPVEQYPVGAGLFLLTAFGLGLAAVFTPCVFPMVPITVSFFLNRRGAIAQASKFACGIVFLFCGLGLGVTALSGPFGVVRLGANPWVNGLIAAVFGIFAFSLLGAFEIALPSGLLTSLDRVSRRDGYFGTLFMGLTFALTSFACVGPFVGSLLAASVQTPGPRTLLGMVSFPVAFRCHSSSSRLSLLTSRNCRKAVRGCYG